MPSRRRGQALVNATLVRIILFAVSMLIVVLLAVMLYKATRAP